jgi:DNA repair exonuclease SbcCD ATPase subunit
MNRKLTDRQITVVCRELLARDPATSGRAVRAELKHRFDSPGKTDRVFAVWRTLRTDSASSAARDTRVIEGLKHQVAELEARIHDAELAREAAAQRAFLSEAREIAHQDRWAHEIHTLRAEVRRLTGEESRRVELESRVLDLARELAQVRTRLAQFEPPPRTPTVAGG